MTLRPDIDRLLARPTAINAAQLELRYAAHCLQKMLTDRDHAAHWLVQADEHIAAAWKRLEVDG